ELTLEIFSGSGASLELKDMILDPQPDRLRSGRLGRWPLWLLRRLHTLPWWARKRCSHDLPQVVVLDDLGLRSPEDATCLRVNQAAVEGDVGLEICDAAGHDGVNAGDLTDFLGGLR